MADSSQQAQRPKGFSNLILHISSDKVGVGLWLTRIITILLAVFGYVVPLLGGVFGDPVACCKSFLKSLSKPVFIGFLK